MGTSRRQRGQRPPHGKTKLRLIATARARLEAGELIQDLTLEKLAGDCGVTRAAAAFHFGDGIRGIVAGLAMETAHLLHLKLQALPSRSGAASIPEVGKTVLSTLLLDSGATVAVLSMRWALHARASQAVNKGIDMALHEMQKRLPSRLPSRLVMGIAEYFFSEIRRGALTQRAAEQSFVDVLERIARP